MKTVGSNSTGRVNCRSNRSWTGRIATCLTLAGCGVIVGAAWTTSGRALGEGQPANQPQHFQSGAQLSVPILKEIAATLKQMDARLARIETAAQQFRPTGKSQAPAR
jgi:hypothetical protein